MPLHRSNAYAQPMVHSWQVEQHTSASIERVWDILVDASRWNEWARFKVSKYEREGNVDTHGVGAIRVFGQPPMLSREEVVAFEPHAHFAYKLLSGMPIDGYRADVHLEATPTGSTIIWASSFVTARPSFTGPFFAWFLRKFIEDTAKRLARRAEVTT
jgi:Polyketide cyclase / dehydrase and lipid transport